MTGKLVFRSLRHESARMLSAVLGVAAATGILAWHLGLAQTAIHSGHETARKATAPFTAWVGAPQTRENPNVIPANGQKDGQPGSTAKGRSRATAEATMGRRMGSRTGRAGIPSGLIDLINGSELVKRTVSIATVNAVMDMRPGGRVLQGPPFSGNVTLLPLNGIPFNVGNIEGRLPNQDSEELEIIANTRLFGTRVPKPELGSTIPYVLANGTVSVKIVGFFEMSRIVDAFPQMYANSAAMNEIIRVSGNKQPVTSLVLVEMKDNAAPSDIGLLIDQATATIDPISDKCPLFTTDAVAERFQSDTVKNLMSQMPMSLTLAVITAACLLSTVLMIGLTLRRRRIAELRCAGMTRGGVAMLILTETLVVLIPGWLLGLGGSALFLQIFLNGEKAALSDMPSVIYLGWQTPVLSAVVAIIVGIFASIAPVSAAIRVKPLEITGTDITASRPVSLWKTLIAIALLLPLPLISMDFAIGNTLKSKLMLLIGLPCFLVSLRLGMQPLMRLVEFLFLKPLGLILRLDSHILERRLSRDPARAAGTILTLSLGLGGFMAVHIWGGTLMSSFVPSPEWPDAIVSVLPNGFSADQVASVRKCRGIADGRVLPVECTQLPMTQIQTTSSRNGATGESTWPEGVLLLFGTNPFEAFGDNPLAPMKFIEGSRVDAARMMTNGDYCVITKMLSNLTGLHKGDAFTVDGRKLEIAGVTDLNWHMVTSRSNVRTRFGSKKDSHRRGGPMSRTIGMAFTSERLVREITGNDNRTYFLWLNMSDELRKVNGLQATVRLDEEIRAAVGDDGANAIRVHHRDEVADGTLAHGTDILGTMARIPFWSLVVTSTGIAVLLVASVRGSKKEFEVMRAVGMTRGQLARLILGEALLVTICALILSLVAGTLIGWSFTGLSNWMMSAGLNVKLIIPWVTISKGILFAFGLCIVMAIIPLTRLIKLVDK